MKFKLSRDKNEQDYGGDTPHVFFLLMCCVIVATSVDNRIARIQIIAKQQFKKGKQR